MGLKLTEHEQNLASENIKLTTELIKRNIGKNGLTYDETYDAAIEALIRSARDFKPSLGYKFSTLYFVAGNNMIKRKIRDKNAKKRTGKTVNIETIEPLSYHEKYPFFDRDEIQSAFKNCGLKEKEKMCVYLYYYKQLSQSQISKLMNCSQFNISRLLTRSVDKLRNYILETR